MEIVNNDIANKYHLIIFFVGCRNYSVIVEDIHILRNIFAVITEQVPFSMSAVIGRVAYQRVVISPTFCDLAC